MAFDATEFAQEFGAQVRAVRKYEKITQMLNDQSLYLDREY